MHLTPYLLLVLAGFGLFIVVLGYVWVQQVRNEQRARRLAAASPAPVRDDLAAIRSRRAA